MNCRGNQAEQFVLITTNEKVERAGVVRHGAINEIAGQLFVARHDEMEILKFRPDGRMKKTVAILAFVMIRRNETGENRDEIEKNQNHAAEHGDAAAFQSVPE